MSFGYHTSLSPFLPFLVIVSSLEGRKASPTKQASDVWITLQGTNISPKKWHFEDDFPFPKVGYVNSLEGNYDWERA